ncbi:prolipoprotein diacylglyceryl transferase [Oribacterium sp. WCC10]|uniref:prolipoprotein diacylglyceryl transferase n=1 Tax=Oribacterium sp. WCC10 TaxID=1855343 RepID=UPI0008F1754B|nr:prolipoprotein diacylglyceryl transferase [Oribacterium sp. WCC10]SFG26600.1 Prolipoprotein diacylglyceryl transferase [Oribacterium sp. WCC10]
MNTDNFDIYFPHLGIGIEHLTSSISVFGFRIAYYGIIIGVGMLLGFFIASLDYKRRGLKVDDIQDMGLYTVIFAILGARAYYVAFEWSYYSQHLDEILNIRQGGLAIYGGIIVSVICCALFCHVRNMNFLSLADSAILGLLTGQSIGRWGNFFNTEAFGGYTDSLFAMRIREAIVNTNMLNDDVLLNSYKIGENLFIQVHPTFFYESMWNLCTLVIFYLMAPRKKFTGQMFFQYLMCYGIGRFWIEGLRTDSLYLWGTKIAVSQLLSGLLAVVGAGLIIYNLNKVKKQGTDVVLKAELEALKAKEQASLKENGKQPENDQKESDETVESEQA